MKKINDFLFLFSSVLLSGFTLANNLIIENVSLPAGNQIQFDISWENSWYTNAEPNNWDAVWVFIKAQDCATDEKAWEHVDLSVNSSDHSAGGVLQVDAVTDGKGVFIRRSAFGGGHIPTTTITLQMQNTYNPANVNFEIMGIEMVYVLEGAFNVGGTTKLSTGSSYVYSYGYGLKRNHEISSEAQISAGVLSSQGNTATSNVGYVPTVPASFPKGYNGFYIMKYEISQEQYVRFLNLLNYTQQAMRTEFDPSSSAGTYAMSPSSSTSMQNRNGIRIKTPATNTSPAVYENDFNGNSTYGENGDGQNIACNFLKWTDLLAYLDWSALRPMTELEYEKACRGFGPVVNDEYAWGNNNLTPTRSDQITNPGEGSEVSTTNLVANHGLASVAASASSTSYGPLRVGFAATSSPSRIYAGASYWGVLDLTGNVWEQTVSVGYANGNQSAFTGVLGDGSLDGTGEANQMGWSLNPVHSIVKGGSYATPISSTNYGYYSAVANRYYINSTTYNNNRVNQTGGRGVRQF